MLERLFRFLGRTPFDKVLHFAGGTILACVGAVAGLEGAILLPLALGTAKEVWDHLNPPHQADPLDLLATLLGAMPVWAAYLIGRLA